MSDLYLQAAPAEETPACRAAILAGFMARHPPATVTHAMALRLAKQCRARINTHLNESEAANLDRDFYTAIHSGLEELAALGAFLDVEEENAMRTHIRHRAHRRSLSREAVLTAGLWAGVMLLITLMGWACGSPMPSIKSFLAPAEISVIAVLLWELVHMLEARRVRR
ncbi:hypothetical protein [Planctomyces sp. SH-PL62]|uniref:hypothetical protein n=1 Tax=Planctomyces sp. SH-PL62 TaxID=1636152 RepID=UPI00078BC926|nr:hypothetical protein [Planctomyces sp. SH-PL62]AMV40260.1 hypothetical protein VT85_22705 [Planctomyces sp. SH-PL62]